MGLRSGYAEMGGERPAEVHDRPAGRFRQLGQRATPFTRIGRPHDAEGVFNHSIARARCKDRIQHLSTERCRRAESASEILPPPFGH